MRHLLLVALKGCLRAGCKRDALRGGYVIACPFIAGQEVREKVYVFE